jgi:hypothetical protein
VIYVMKPIILFELGEGCGVEHAEYYGVIERNTFRC